MGKNQPNDELDLKIPVWDADVHWLSRSDRSSIVCCTAYSDIREYDTRGARKSVISSKVWGNQSGKDKFAKRELYLSRIFQSK